MWVLPAVVAFAACVTVVVAGLQAMLMATRATGMCTLAFRVSCHALFALLCCAHG